MEESIQHSAFASVVRSKKRDRYWLGCYLLQSTSEDTLVSVEWKPYLLTKLENFLNNDLYAYALHFTNA